MVIAVRRPEDPDLAANRQTASLAALAVSMALVVAGLYVVDRLRTASALQDCALSGHGFCVTVAAE